MFIFLLDLAYLQNSFPYEYLRDRKVLLTVNNTVDLPNWIINESLSFRQIKYDDSENKFSLQASRLIRTFVAL